MSEEVKNEETQTEEVKEETPAEAPKEEVKAEEPKEEPKKEAKEEAPKEEKPAPSGKFKEVIEKIESLTALELAELVKELEERFGVSAAQPVAVAGAPVAGGADAAGAEEKSAYTIVLAASGDKKINVIKAVREINPELGLKEAKDVVDGAPKEIKQDVPKDEAEEAKKKLEEAGATVELK
jgi:large subunit ribosomal protein L7/L12